jgi:hypothetical protein
MLTEMMATKQAAFITGRILHRGTGLPIQGQIQIKARDVPIVAKVLDDGTFVISGATDQIFPQLNAQAYSIELNIQAVSGQFRRGLVEYARLENIPAGISFDPDAVEPFRSLIDLGNIYLPVDPAIDSSADPTVYQDNLLVEIRGRILQAKKPEENFPTPPKVQVVVDGAAPIEEVVANADGRYRFSSIVMRLPAEIRCSASGFQPIRRPLLVDFGKVVNQEDFRLLSI